MWGESAWVLPASEVGVPQVPRWRAELIISKLIQDDGDHSARQARHSAAACSKGRAGGESAIHGVVVASSAPPEYDFVSS